jgi:hypothetical protein
MTGYQELGPLGPFLRLKGPVKQHSSHHWLPIPADRYVPMPHVAWKPGTLLTRVAVLPRGFWQ